MAEKNPADIQTQVVHAGERKTLAAGEPTTDALVDALRTIEDGAAACAYASGMAALHAALLCCDLKSGSTVLASQDLYGATPGLLQTIFKCFSVNTVPVA